MSEDDYYKILSVEPTASQAEVNEAARKLLEVWIKVPIPKSDANKLYEMLSQITRASAVLTDPVRRLEYDVEHGHKNHFQGQTKQAKDPLPINESESIEAFQTFKIRGGLDYDYLQKSIAAVVSSTSMEIPSDWLLKDHFKPLKPPIRHIGNVASEEMKSSGPWIGEKEFYGRRYISKDSISRSDSKTIDSTELKNIEDKSQVSKDSDSSTNLLATENGTSKEMKSCDSWIEKEAFPERSYKYGGCSTENIYQDGSTSIDSIEGSVEDQSRASKDLGSFTNLLDKQSESEQEAFIKQIYEISSRTDKSRQTPKTDDAYKNFQNEQGPKMVPDTFEAHSQTSRHFSEPGSKNLEKSTPSRNTGANLVDLQKETLTPIESAESLEKFETQYIDLFNKIKDTLSRRRTAAGQLKPTDFDHRMRKYRTGSLPFAGEKGNENRSERLQHAIQLLGALEVSEEERDGISESAYGGESKVIRHTIKQRKSEGEILNELESMIDNFRRSIDDATTKKYCGKNQKVDENRRANNYASEIQTEKDDYTTASRRDRKDYATSDETSVESWPSSEIISESHAILGQEKLSNRRYSWSSMSSEKANDDEIEWNKSPLKSVSATTRIAGADIQTVYHFGPETELIEVFVNGEVKARITNETNQDVYCNMMKHEDLTPGVDMCASTVIAANNCIVTTEVTRRSKRESIAVYKDEELLCRTGNTILE